MDAGDDDDLRERTRQQLLSSLGGWSGTVAASIPPVVFVVANAAAGLRAAVIAAVGAGILVALYRLLRKQSIQQAFIGLVSVAVAAAVAARTGQARGFFLLGIAGSFVYGGVCLATLVVRRPLVGLLWEFLDPSPLPDGTQWHRVRNLARAYDLATAAAVAMFAARALVQLSLFQQNRTGWLAFARIAMGYPLYIAVVGFAFWIVRRARAQLPAVELPSGSTDRLADGGLGLRQGDEE